MGEGASGRVICVGGVLWETIFSVDEIPGRGVKLLPMYAGFRPDEKRLDPMWRYASEHRLPVLLHTGTTFVAQVRDFSGAQENYESGGIDMDGSATPAPAHGG